MQIARCRRDEFSVRLFIANAATTVAEFAGIAGASQLLFGEFARYIAIPICAFFVWFLVLRGSFRVGRQSSDTHWIE